MATNLIDKIKISIFSSIIFFIVNLPQVYKITNGFLGNKIYDTLTNCPTKLGLLAHSSAFFLLTFLSMLLPLFGKNDKKDDGKKLGHKIKHSLYGTLIFFFLSSPAAFSIVGSFLGSQYSNKNGCPTLKGILLHSAIYCVSLILVMFLP